MNPGPGANAIVTMLNIRLNPDGTLAATPRMVLLGQPGREPAQRHRSGLEPLDEWRAEDYEGEAGRERDP